MLQGIYKNTCHGSVHADLYHSVGLLVQFRVSLLVPD